LAALAFAFFTVSLPCPFLSVILSPISSKAVERLLDPLDRQAEWIPPGGARSDRSGRGASVAPLARFDDATEDHLKLVREAHIRFLHLDIVDVEAEESEVRIGLAAGEPALP
jgi:hypothetical protein